MKEMVIISGKGGTGKTSIVASFAALAKNSVLADCDVDAADLHLILEPDIYWKEKFSGGSRARILPGHCTACGKCEEICRFDAIYFDGPGNGVQEKTFRIDPITCEGCGVCAWFCAEKAIEFAPAVNGEWYKSETRFGPMVHARLGAGEENSGKLVTLVRKEAGKIAEEKNIDLLIVDGSPGIGCPVIASITGADMVVIVTEPTLSGLHDLKRVAKLTRQFDIPTLACINKWDLNPELASAIESEARQQELGYAGRVRYDKAATLSQIEKKSIVEYQSGGAAEDIQAVWSKVRLELEKLGASVSNSVFSIGKS
ncbi:MAG: ATP-binding protein [Candidatus Omnitrophica bacterium]|nr:ATP-binding protein [Candidatus Omnitrophota bacterium]